MLVKHNVHITIKYEPTKKMECCQLRLVKFNKTNLNVRRDSTHKNLLPKLSEKTIFASNFCNIIQIYYRTLKMN